jgi:outer membrane receptor protein involved in Fe transport
MRMLARGRTFDIDPSFGAFGGTLWAPGYVSFDAGGAVRFAGRFDAYARAMNLFDQSYEEVLGYPALGRQFVVGARLALGR